MNKYDKTIMINEMQKDWELLLAVNGDLLAEPRIKTLGRRCFSVGYSSALKEIIVSLGNGGSISRDKIVAMLDAHKNFIDNTKFDDLLGK